MGYENLKQPIPLTAKNLIQVAIELSPHNLLSKMHSGHAGDAVDRLILLGEICQGMHQMTLPATLASGDDQRVRLGLLCSNELDAGCTSPLISLPGCKATKRQPDGDPIDGEQRLQNFNFCQHALKGKANVALMFDEMEDVLLGGDDSPSLFGLAKWRGTNKGGKAWINRALEQNPIPTIWITNDADIDEAYLRRFDYSVPLRVPPRQVRQIITANYLAEFSPHPDKLSALADLDDLLPSQLERAARVAKLSGQDGSSDAWQQVEQSLLRSRELLGQSRVSLQPTAPIRCSVSPTYLSSRSEARFTKIGTPSSSAMWRASKLLPVSVDQPTAELLLNALLLEVKMKRHGKETIGFI